MSLADNTPHHTPSCPNLPGRSHAHLSGLLCACILFGSGQQMRFFSPAFCRSVMCPGLKTPCFRAGPLFLFFFLYTHPRVHLHSFPRLLLLLHQQLHHPHHSQQQHEEIPHKEQDGSALAGRALRGLMELAVGRLSQPRTCTIDGLVLTVHAVLGGLSTTPRIAHLRLSHHPRTQPRPDKVGWQPSDIRLGGAKDR